VDTQRLQAVELPATAWLPVIRSTRNVIKHLVGEKVISQLTRFDRHSVKQVAGRVTQYLGG